MDDGDMTRGPLENYFCDKGPEILEDFLHTPGDWKVKKKIIDLHFYVTNFVFHEHYNTLTKLTFAKVGKTSIDDKCALYMGR